MYNRLPNAVKLATYAGL